VAVLHGAARSDFDSGAYAIPVAVRALQRSQIAIGTWIKDFRAAAAIPSEVLPPRCRVDGLAGLLGAWFGNGGPARPGCILLIG